MNGHRTAAWVLVHSDANRLSLVSPCQQLILGPYTSICDVEQALKRLCRLSPSTTAVVTFSPNGRTKVRFSNAVEFTVTSKATAETVAARSSASRHNASSEQGRAQQGHSTRTRDPSKGNSASAIERRDQRLRGGEIRR